MAPPLRGRGVRTGVFPSSNINGRQSALALARVLVSILERIKIDKSRLDHVVTDNGGAAPVIARSLASLLNKTVDGVLCAVHRLQTVLRSLVGVSQGVSSDSSRET